MKKTIASIILILIITLVSLPFVRNTEKIMLNQEIRSKQSGSFIELPKGVTHYENAGPDTAQTVVLIHGGTVPYYVWDPTYTALVEQGFRVIRYDLFGRGYSDRPETQYDRALFEQQLSNLISKLKVDKPVDLVGMSLGGAIAAGFTVNNPHKVRKVVLIEPLYEVLNIPGIDVPFLGEYLMKALVAPSLPARQMADFYQPDKFADWPDKYREQMKYKGFRQAILSTLRNFMNTSKLPVYQALGRLEKPELLIWGLEDNSLPIASSKIMMDVLDVDVFTVEQAGHIPHYERPEIVNKEIIRFLRE